MRWRTMRWQTMRWQTTSWRSRRSRTPIPGAFHVPRSRSAPTRAPAYTPVPQPRRRRTFGAARTAPRIAPLAARSPRLSVTHPKHTHPHAPLEPREPVALTDTAPWPVGRGRLTCGRSACDTARGAAHTHQQLYSSLVTDPRSRRSLLFSRPAQTSARDQPEISQRSARGQPEISQRSARDQPEISQRSARGQPAIGQRSASDRPEVSQRSARDQPEVSQRSARDQPEVNQRSAEVGQRSARDQPEISQR